VPDSLGDRSITAKTKEISYTEIPPLHRQQQTLAVFLSLSRFQDNQAKNLGT